VRGKRAAPVDRDRYRQYRVLAKTFAMRHTRAAILVLVGLLASDAMAVCGDGKVDGNELCDGDPCCTADCEQVLDGTLCGDPVTPCRLTSACYDAICFRGEVLPDGTSCDDGDPCTENDTCRSGECQATFQRCDAVPSASDISLAKILTAPAAGFLTVDCSVTTAGGSGCTAAAFLPSPGAAAIPQGLSTTPAPDVACDFTRQITRTAARPLAGSNTRLKLKLSKLGRRLMRMAAASLPATMTVCTKVAFANGESITLVDTVTVRP
jgi:hypothetical protein